LTEVISRYARQTLRCNKLLSRPFNRPNNAAAMAATRCPAKCGYDADLRLGKYTGEPISVNLKDVDLRDFFRLIHEISGLNVVLGPRR